LIFLQYRVEKWQAWPGIESTILVLGSQSGTHNDFSAMVTP